MMAHPSFPFHGRSKLVFGLASILIILSTFSLFWPSSSAASYTSTVARDYQAVQNPYPIPHSKGHKSSWSWFSKENSQPQSVNDEDTIPLARVEDYVQSYLQKASTVNLTYYNETYGLQLGSPDLASYTKDLEDIYKTYLAPLSEHDSFDPSWIEYVRARLSLRPVTTSLPVVPKQIFTTEKVAYKLPEEFVRWKEVMRDWSVRVFDDRALSMWVNSHFRGSKADELFRGLPEKVLQTDMFRYMAMLVEGGIYTDSDTTPIAHADHWGRPYSDMTPPLLKHLTRILHLGQPAPGNEANVPLRIDSRRRRSRPRRSTSNEIQDGEMGPPSLIISVELDAPYFKYSDWRSKGFKRAIQMTQWTFLARPGHPVFLDALGTSLRRSEEVAESMREKWREEPLPENADWTGTGVFTDCVFRYLLARYGIRPEQLTGHKDPFRIGDVLILPTGSFSSVSPFDDHEQRAWAAVWHGYNGRWRTFSHVKGGYKQPGGPG